MTNIALYIALALIYLVVFVVELETEKESWRDWMWFVLSVMFAPITILIVVGMGIGGWIK